MILINSLNFNTKQILYIFIIIIKFDTADSHMQNIISLFNRSFKKIPGIQSKLGSLSTGLTTKTSIYDLCMLLQYREIRSRLIYLSRLILDEASELQNQTPIQLINRFCCQYDQISYSPNPSSIILKKYPQSAGIQISYQISSVQIQKFDHPFIRDTLYFHEMKDADKYYNFTIPSAFPKYMQDECRSILVNQALDQKNPFGVPIWEKPLKLCVQIQKGQKIHRFHLSSYLGKTALKKCEWKDLGKQEKYEMNTLLFDEKFQKWVFDLLKDKANITEQQISEMKKLMFVGGSAQKLDFMIDLFEELGHKYFHKAQSE